MQNLMIELSEVELDAVAGGAGLANFSFWLRHRGQLGRSWLFGNTPLQLRLPSRQLLLRSGTSSSIPFSAMTVVS
jgi:hypothetical protein